MRLVKNSTAHLIILSALIFSSIPVLLSFGSENLTQVLALLLILFKLAVALPSFFSRISRASLHYSLRNKDFVISAILQAALFLLSILFLAVATTKGVVTTAIVVSETWPIMTAVLLAPLLGKQVEKLQFREFFWGTMAFIGVAIIIYEKSGTAHIGQGHLTALFFGLASALCMGVSSALKARCVRILSQACKIGQVRIYFILQMYFLPLLIPFGLFFVAFGQADLSTVPALITDATTAMIVGGVFLANFSSSVLFSMATMRIKRASDTFIWFFAPAFSFLLLYLFTSSPIEPRAWIGLLFVLSSNIVVSLSADNALSFRAFIASLLITGALCFFVPPLVPALSYFEPLSILTIFFVIVLSFSMDQAVRLRDTAMRTTLSLARLLDARGSDWSRRMTDLLAARRHPVLFKRAYRILRRDLLAITARDEIEVLDELALTRDKGIGLGLYVSLGSTILATTIIGILARPQSWIANIFITIYIPSMIFAFTTLVDLLIEQRSFIRPIRTKGGHSHIVRILARRASRENIVWSSVLSVFVVASYILIFVTQRGG